MVQYLLRNHMKLVVAFIDHLWMVVLSVLIALPIALLLGIIAYHNRTFRTITLGMFVGIYTIPSLAMFAFLIPLTGLGKTTAVVGLVLYSQLVLLRSFLTAMDAIPAGSIEAANAMGLTFKERVRNVDIPLALPYLLGGIRIATITSTGIASMAALINAGGIGAILFEGMRTMHIPKLICGIVLICLLAMCFNKIFAVLEKTAYNYANGLR